MTNGRSAGSATGVAQQLAVLARRGFTFFNRWTAGDDFVQPDLLAE